MISTRSACLVLTTAVFAIPAASAVTLGPTFLGPIPYRGFDDSPFKGLLSQVLLEDFEQRTPADDQLNTLGVSTTTPGTILAPSVLTDSVDKDDGVVDGSGTAGRSLLSRNPQSGVGFTTFAFEFDAALLGGLPTHVGFVWTDVGATTSTPGVGDVVFSVSGVGNLSLGSFTVTGLGDGVASGGTAEDRFIGVIAPAGVFRIEIAMPTSEDWEIDHLQYSVAPVPLPAAGWLLGAALAGLGWRRRRA